MAAASTTLPILIRQQNSALGRCPHILDENGQRSRQNGAYPARVPHNRSDLSGDGGSH